MIARRHRHEIDWPRVRSTGILVAASCTLVRDALRALLQHEGFDVVAEASTGLDALHVARRVRPEIALIAANLALVGGRSVARKMDDVSPTTRTIVLAISGDNLVDGLDGSISYVPQAGGTADLLRAMRGIRSLGTCAGTGGSSLVPRERKGRGEPGETLTGRELQVLQLIAEGKTTREAADALGMSQRTADCHRTHIMAKLGLRGTASLVRYAIRTGMIRP